MTSAAFLGLGLMGSYMVANLSKATDLSYINVWNRTHDKAVQIAAEHPDRIKAVQDVTEAISSAKYVFVMLNDFKAIQSTLSQDSVLKTIGGKIVTVCSTLSSKETSTMAKSINEAGGFYIESPVFGLPPAAKAAQLQFLLGSTFKESITAIETLLVTMGVIKFRSEEYGKASVLKLSINQLIGSQIAAFSFSMALISKHGIDPQAFMDVERGLACHSKYFDLKFENCKNRVYTPPTFYPSIWAKDLHCMVEEGEAVGIETMVPEAMEKLARLTCELGWSEHDVVSCHEAILKNRNTEKNIL